MRTEIEALKEIRDRLSYFCARTDGKYDPVWVKEIIGIIDDVLITPRRWCEKAVAEKSSVVGSTVKLCEAVDKIKNTANSALTAFSIGNDMSSFLLDIIRECETALATPPRNCDIGTADEQAERYRNFCRSYQKCTECPCASRRAQSNSNCEFAWAQMPYKEGGTK